MSSRFSGDIGRERQAAIVTAGVGGRRPRIPTTAASLEAEAERVMSPEGFAYVAGGAGAEAGVRANLAAWARWRIVPRVLRGVQARDTSTTLFGRRLPFPLLLAPVGAIDLAHPAADLAVARAAGRAGVPMVFSSQASVPMERCAAAMGDGPRWFQLYWGQSDAVMQSFVRRAEAIGCQAIVLTVDTSFLGWRPRDLALGYLPFLHGRGIAQYTSDPAFQESLRTSPAPAGPRPPLSLATLRTVVEQARRHPGGLLGNLRSGVGTRAVRQFLSLFSRPALDWEDLARLRELTRLPVLLKGVLHPEDARRALAAGVDGLIVSNHGGRQLDGVVATFDALPGVVRAVGGRIPVLVDGGVRGAADIFKAVALGAAAVLVGRPCAYALALAGEDGVAQLLADLHAEFDITLALAGCRTVAEIGPELLTRDPP